MGPRAGLDGRKNLVPTGIRSPGRPARSQHDCSTQIYTEVPSHNKLPHYFGFVAYGFRNRKIQRSLNVRTRQHSMSLSLSISAVEVYTSFIFLWVSQSQSTTFKFSMNDPNLKH